MKIEEIINKNFDNLNKSEKNIAEFILNNKNECINYSSQEISDTCFVSRATLLRFCKKIGLKSFSDLKYLLKQNDVVNSNNIIDLYDTYHTMINELKKTDFLPICEKIYNADVIYIYGTGNEQKTIADEFKRIFLTVGKVVVPVFDYGEVEFLKTLFKENDVFIIISLSGETKSGIDILKLIIPSGINTISITRLANNTISRLSNLNLFAVTQNIDYINNTNYELVSIFYIMIDILLMKYIEYSRRIENEY